MGMWAHADLTQQQKDAQSYGGRSDPRYGEDPNGYKNAEKKRWGQLAGPQGMPKLDPWFGQNAQSAYDQQRYGSRAEQQKALSMMQAIASGQTQTPAMQQLAQGFQASGQANLALGNSARGNAYQQAMAQRQAAQSNAAAAGGENRQMQILQAGEQQRAQQGIASMSAAMRAQDLMSQGLTQEEAIARAQDEFKLGQMNDKRGLQYAGLANNADAQSMFGMNAANQLIDQYGRESSARDAQMGMSGVNALTTGAASAASYFGQDKDFKSDERAKSKDPGAGHMMDSFLDILDGSKAAYRYKSAADEPRETPTGGEYLGVMAQDLERAPGVGRQLVRDTPGGKMVETPAMVSALSAGLGRVHERLRRLEGKK